MITVEAKTTGPPMPTAVGFLAPALAVIARRARLLDRLLAGLSLSDGGCHDV